MAPCSCSLDITRCPPSLSLPRTKMEIDSEQSYSAILKYLRLFTVAIGFDVFRTNYRPGLVTFLMYMDIVAFVGCMLYTVYQNRADAIEMLKAFYVIGVPIQGFIKSSTLVYYSRDIYAMNAQVLRLHRTTRGAWRRCLYEWTRRTDVVLKLQLFLYTITGFFFMTAPLFYYAMYGKRVLNMTMEAPGVDASTATGFVVMMAFEVYSVFLAVCIIFSVDGVFIIMCFVACAYEEMVRLKYEELADFLERTDVYDDRAVGEMLRSVIVADLQAEGFINRIRMYFEKGCAVQMYTGGLSLAFSIIVARTVSNLRTANTPSVCSYSFLFAPDLHPTRLMFS